VCFDRISSKDDLVEKSGAVRQAFSARASGVRAQKKKRRSDQRANEKLNRQGFKTDTNYVLLWLRISAVSCDSNYTAELTDVNVCGAEAEPPELYLIESVL